MVSVERSLKESFRLYRDNPIFIIPHLAESILNILIFISMAISVLLAIGVHITNLTLEDPAQLLGEILAAGPGLIAMLILSFLFTLLVTRLVSAAALAGVVEMARAGFKGEGVTLGKAFEAAKRHALEVFIYWLALLLILILVFAMALVPALILTIAGASHGLALASTAIFLLFSLLLSALAYIALLFTPQYLVVERKGVAGSLRASMSFVKEHPGSVVLYVAVAALISLFLFGIFAILSFIPNLLYNASRLLGAFSEILLNLLSMLASLIVAPYFDMVKTGMIMEMEQSSR